MRKRIYPDRINVGLAIGTYAAVPYVHMHLEARRRLYPNTRALVHDDDSPCAPELEALCGLYGADFIKTDTRRRHTCGDLAAFVAAIEWGNARGVDIVVKLSRRFVPVTDCMGSLLRLAEETQQAGFTSRCDYHGFGFRSECVAMHAASWAGLAADFLRHHRDAGKHCFAENLVHQAAFMAQEDSLNVTGALWRMLHPAEAGAGGYAPWDFMGRCRVERQAGFLWHEWAPPSEYAAVARAWGVDYPEEAWADPNAGMGEAHH